MGRDQNGRNSRVKYYGVHRKCVSDMHTVSITEEDKNLNRKQWRGYICLMPVLLLVIIFLLYPFIEGVKLSFFSSKYGFGDAEFVGLNNYIDMMHNQYFHMALKNSLIWVGISTILNFSIPLMIALLLNRSFKGKQFVIGGILIPWLTPVVGFGMMWKWLLEPEMGVINTALKKVELITSGINFLGSTDLAMPTMILLNFLQFCPFGVLLMLSALSTISDEQYDAMYVDGACGRAVFQYLIMPAIARMTGFLLFLGCVWTFSNYSLIYIMTKGGPSYSTYTIPIMIYEKAFTEFEIGESTALAAIIAFVLFILGYLYFRNSVDSKEVMR